MIFLCFHFFSFKKILCGNIFRKTLFFQMLSKLVLTTCLLLTISGSSQAASMEEIQSEKFCEKFPTLHMCRLKEELTGSLVELQYLLQDGESAGIFFLVGRCSIVPLV